MMMMIDDDGDLIPYGRIHSMRYLMIRSSIAVVVAPQHTHFCTGSRMIDSSSSSSSTVVVFIVVRVVDTVFIYSFL